MRVTAKLEDRHLEFFERVRDEENTTSDAETIRRCLERGATAEERVDALEDEIENLEARVDELTNQLREANKRNDEVEELVEYVESERSLQERREERRTSPVWKRARWWVFGEPDDE
jgi:peptidoglycan hydrolase CwlO-like protein